jgi:hypothetical protein
MEALQKTGTQEKHDDLTAFGTYPINPKKAKAASPSDPRDGF